MASANKITEAKRAFARDANFQRLKARFPANTNTKRLVTNKGKKK
jgi:hypothetical protein